MFAAADHMGKKIKQCWSRNCLHIPSERKPENKAKKIFVGIKANANSLPQWLFIEKNEK